MLGQHLADLGAEVVKVEWYKRYDLYRTRGVEHLAGKMRESDRRESSYPFQCLNRNKLGFAADLKTDLGLDLVKDLIRESDILIENFSVGTLDKLGLDSNTLRDLNELLVVISLSATGRGSRVENLRSYGLMLSALGGFESEVKDENGDFLGSPTFVMSDPNAALFGVFAALAGVLHSRDSGSGSVYECSQVEAVVSLMDAPVAPKTEQYITEGIFRTAGGDFCAISLPPNSHTSLGEPGSTSDWIAKQSTDVVISTIKELGGIATQVRDLSETESAEEFAGSEVRQAVDHPITGPTKLVATPWTINGKRSTVRKPSPMIGADNDYVMHDILGYASEKIASIHSSGVVDEVKQN